MTRQYLSITAQAAGALAVGWVAYEVRHIQPAQVRIEHVNMQRQPEPPMISVVGAASRPSMFRRLLAKASS